jgi:hypothetical protein
MTYGDPARVRTRRLVAFASAAILLASCKGGSTRVSAGTTTVPTTAAPTTVPPTTDPAKAAKAQAAVVQATDFPPGWGTQPEDAGLNIETVWRDITTCSGVQQAAPDLALATSPTYLQGLATQVRSSVEYTTPAAASAYASVLTGPNFTKCATDAFAADVNRSKPEGSTAGPVTVTPRDYQQYGQKTLAWRINAIVDLGGLQVPLYQDYIVIFNGGTVIRLFFLNPGAEFPQNLEKSLVQDVVSRA